MIAIRGAGRQLTAIAFAASLFALSLGAIWLSMEFPAAARLAPLLAAIPMAIAMFGVLLREVLLLRAQWHSGRADPADDHPVGDDSSEDMHATEDPGHQSGSVPATVELASDAPSEQAVLGTYWQGFASLTILVAMYYLFGSIVASFAYPPLHLLLVRYWSPRAAIVTSLVAGLLTWGLLDNVLNVTLYGGVL